MKVVGVVKSIVGTDAVIAIDEDGNQRAIFPGDTLYDNEKLLELSGVQVNVEPVTVADAQKKSEPNYSLTLNRVNGDIVHYTRYEASDTATGTKYFIDVHNDINLQIL